MSVQNPLWDVTPGRPNYINVHVDAAIAALERKAERAALEAEVVERILNAHDRAFWEYLRQLMPWYPPFDEAWPDGVV